jgi:hypothetical protein
MTTVVTSLFIAADFIVFGRREISDFTETIFLYI